MFIMNKFYVRKEGLNLKKKYPVRKHVRKYKHRGRVKSITIGKHYRSYGAGLGKIPLKKVHIDKGEVDKLVAKGIPADEAMQKVVHATYGGFVSDLLKKDNEFDENFERKKRILDEEIGLIDSLPDTFKRKVDNLKKEIRLYTNIKKNIVSNMNKTNSAIDKLKEEYAQKQDLLQEKRERELDSINRSHKFRYDLLLKEYSPKIKQLNDQIERLEKANRGLVYSGKKEGVGNVKKSESKITVDIDDLVNNAIKNSLRDANVKDLDVKKKLLEGDIKRLSKKDFMPNTMKQLHKKQGQLAKLLHKKKLIESQVKNLKTEKITPQDKGNNNKAKSMYEKVTPDNHKFQDKTQSQNTSKISELKLKLYDLMHNFKDAVNENNTKFNIKKHSAIEQYDKLLDRLSKKTEYKLDKYSDDIEKARRNLSSIDANQKSIQLNINKTNYDYLNALEEGKINKVKLLSLKDQLESKKGYDRIVFDINKKRLKKLKQPSAVAISNVRSSDV